MEKETKIIIKWSLYSILLTLTFVLIFLCLPWIAEKITGNLGIKNGTEAIFVMMLVFYWSFGIIVGLKFCADELEELEKGERNENKEIKKEEETEIKIANEFEKMAGYEKKAKGEILDSGLHNFEGKD